MSKNVKIALAVLGGLLVLCVCAVVVGGMYMSRVVNTAVKSDPAAAQATARSIADFTLPARYTSGTSSAFAMDLLGFKVAGFTARSGEAIMLISVPKQNSAAQNEQIMKQLRSQTLGKMSDQFNFETTDRKPVTVRGQAAEMIISEGSTQAGNAVRQAMISFMGKNGPAILTIVGPADGWDDAEVAGFVASVR